MGKRPHFNPQPRPTFGKYPGEIYLIDERARVRFRAKPMPVPHNPFAPNSWKWGGFEAVSIRKPERLRKAEEDFRRRMRERIPLGWDRMG